MFEIPDVMRMAQAMARHSAARQVTISENIANADTPGFRARDLPDFGATYNQPKRLAATRVSHLDWQAGTPRHVAQVDRTSPVLSPNGNSVSLEREMMRGAQNKQSHELALAVYGSARTILRTALGR